MYQMKILVIDILNNKKPIDDQLTGCGIDSEVSGSAESPCQTAAAGTQAPPDTA
jgi:hypothetical protein